MCYVCNVQRTGQCVRSVTSNDLHCHITVDVVVSVFDAWIIIVHGTFDLLLH